MRNFFVFVTTLWCWFAFTAVAGSDTYLGMTKEYWDGVGKANEGNLTGAIADFTKAIKKERDASRRADAYHHRALAKADLKDYQGWLEDENAALQLRPNDPDILVKRGNAKSWLNDWEGQLDDCQRANNIVSKSRSTKEYRAGFTKELAEVKESFARNVEARDHPEAYKHYQAGIAKNIAKDYAGSVAELTEAIKLSPKFPCAYWERAKSRSWTGEWEGRVADLQKASDLATNTVGLPLDDYHSELADAQSSLMFDVEARDHPDAFKAYKRGQALDAQTNYAAAVAGYTEAIELHPTFAEYYHERGTSRAETKDREGALADAKQAILLNPNEAKYYQARANAESWFDRWEDRVADLTKAVSLYPAGSDKQAKCRAKLNSAKESLAEDIETRDHPEAYARFESGNAKLRQKDYSGALAEFDAAIKLSPQYAGYYWKRGRAKGWLNDDAGWASDESTAISLDPDRADYYSDLGDAKGFLKDYAAKVANYDKALALDPDQATYYHQRGSGKSYSSGIPMDCPVCSGSRRVRVTD